MWQPWSVPAASLDAGAGGLRRVRARPVGAWQHAVVATSMISPEYCINLPDLMPHAEGRHFAESECSFIDGGHASGTAIHFPLRAGGVSHRHWFDSVETWHHYAGVPPTLNRRCDSKVVASRPLGTDVWAGDSLPFDVAPGEWLSTRTLSEWAVVGTPCGRVSSSVPQMRRI